MQALFFIYKKYFLYFFKYNFNLQFLISSFDIHMRKCYYDFNLTNSL